MTRLDFGTVKLIVVSSAEPAGIRIGAVLCVQYDGTLIEKGHNTIDNTV